MEGPCPDKFQFVVHVPGRVWGGTAFAKRSEAMKAPVGLLSGSAVCDSRWRGVAPTSTPQQEHFGNSQALEKRSPGWPLLHPQKRIIGFGRWFFFVLLALCGMVWYTRLSSTTRNFYPETTSQVLTVRYTQLNSFSERSILLKTP